jgi:hypothetical protein
MSGFKDTRINPVGHPAPFQIPQHMRLNKGRCQITGKFSEAFFCTHSYIEATSFLYRKCSLSQEKIESLHTNGLR